MVNFSHFINFSHTSMTGLRIIFKTSQNLTEKKKTNPKLCTCMSRHKRQRDVFSLKKYKLHLGRFTGISNLNMHWSLFLWKFNSSLKFVDRRIRTPKCEISIFYYFFYISCCSVGKHLCTAPFLRRTRGKNVTLQLLSWRITVSFEAFKVYLYFIWRRKKNYKTVCQFCSTTLNENFSSH